MNGFIHTSCLLEHPQKEEIQQELVDVYIKIFENHPSFPIVAQLEYILAKYRPDIGILEIYDFEDFIEFYLPLEKLKSIKNINKNQTISFSFSQWNTLYINKKGKLSIVEKFRSNETKKVIVLKYLDREKFIRLITDALSSEIASLYSG